MPSATCCTARCTTAGTPTPRRSRRRWAVRAHPSNLMQDEWGAPCPGDRAPPAALRAGQRAMPDCYTYPCRTDALTQDSGLRTQHSGLVGMLLELAIRDFAIIDRLRLDFGPGFNALTG